MLRKQLEKNVLIESDWNLKKDSNDISVAYATGINRIRLEFKVLIQRKRQTVICVLIESDWNLKHIIPTILILMLNTY